MTDRVELKRSARERLRSAQPSAFLVALVFLLVSLAFDFFAQKVPLLQVDLWGMQQAMEEINKGSGSLYDPGIVDVVNKIQKQFHVMEIE